MKTTNHPPQPAPEPTREHLPSAITFYTTALQRRSILRALRAIDDRRTPALLRALGLARLADQEVRP